MILHPVPLKLKKFYMNSGINSAAIVRFAHASDGKPHEFPSGVKVTARVDKGTGNISIGMHVEGQTSPHIGQSFQSFCFDHRGNFPEGLSIPKGRPYKKLRGAMYLLRNLDELRPVTEPEGPSFIPCGKTTRHLGKN